MPTEFTQKCVDCGTTIWTGHPRCLSCGQRDRRKRERHEIRQPIPNPEDSTGLTMLVPLTKGKFAVIDSTDADLVRGHLWHARESKFGLWYAQTRIQDSNGVWDTIQMHRLIANPADDQETDHRDRDGLNNRRSNLRQCTSALNKANCLSRSALGLKGVKPRPKNRWGSYIVVAKKFHWLGTFATPEEAARAYDARALIEFGEFALLNFPDDHQ